MSFRIFQYPLPAPPDLEDLNAYLRSHRIVSISHHLVESGDAPMLVFLVQTVEASPTRTRVESRIDYREVLSDEEFARFSRLREVRKQIAEEQGVPVYTILTNAQLAEIARQDLRDPAGLAKIDGIGKARVEKYGERLLAALKDQEQK